MPEPSGRGIKQVRVVFSARRPPRSGRSLQNPVLSRQRAAGRLNELRRDNGSGLREDLRPY